MSEKKTSKTKPKATRAPRKVSSKASTIQHGRPSMGRATVPPGLHDAAQRAEWDLPESESVPGAYMVELNLLYREGLPGADAKFIEMYARVLGKAGATRPPVLISKTYYRCKISVNEWRKLVKEDEKSKDKRDRVIYRIWRLSS